MEKQISTGNVTTSAKHFIGNFFAGLSVIWRLGIVPFFGAIWFLVPGALLTLFLSFSLMGLVSFFSTIKYAPELVIYLSRGAFIVCASFFLVALVIYIAHIGSKS